MQVEGFRFVLPVEPDPSPVHVDRAVDPEQIQGVIEDHGIEGCLDTVADAEVLARLDVDDPEFRLPAAPLTEHDQIGAAGGEPVYLRIKAVVAQEVDRNRDGRLVDRLSGGEPREDLKTLLDGERPV